MDTLLKRLLDNGIRFWFIRGDEGHLNVVGTFKTDRDGILVLGMGEIRVIQALQELTLVSIQLWSVGEISQLLQEMKLMLSKATGDIRHKEYMNTVIDQVLNN